LSRWRYRSEVWPKWLKEILDNVGEMRGQAGITANRKAGMVKGRQGNELDWYITVNPKSIALGPNES
jgi:hypothetical protein